jgi:hypothetical protein
VGGTAVVVLEIKQRDIAGNSTKYIGMTWVTSGQIIRISVFFFFLNHHAHVFSQE